jgi:hypothetical protein
MTLIILLAEMVILIPSLSRFHHNEMLIEARRQLYLHQVAILHGNQDFASEISPKEGKPRITLTAKTGQPISAYYNAEDPSPMPPYKQSKILVWLYPDSWDGRKSPILWHSPLRNSVPMMKI